MRFRLAVATLTAPLIAVLSGALYASAASAQSETLPTLPCALAHDEAALVEAMSPAGQFERDRSSGRDGDYRIRENTEIIAGIMGSLVHPGTWDGKPDAVAQAHLADPVVHAHDLCFDAYYLRELRAEIAIIRLPDGANAQKQKLNDEVTEDNRSVGFAAETPAKRREMARIKAAGDRLAVAGQLRQAAPPDCAKCINDYQLAMARYSAELRDAQREYCESGEAPQGSCQ
jgi:hypothetical protein